MPKIKTELRWENKVQRDVNWANKNIKILNYKCSIIYQWNLCDVCHLAKQRRLSYSPSINKASKIFELVHMDIWGPFSKASIHDHKYFITILDDYSHYTYMVMLKKIKGRGQITTAKFHSFDWKKFEAKVKSIRSDNGPEFFLKKFFASNVILHQTSCVATPQKNGRVERKHQHILNVVRALMFQSHIPSHFWSYVIKHIYLIN